MISLSEFLKKYEVDKTELKIGNRRFKFFLPQDISKFVNQEDPFADFPLWAKIWEGAIVLADYVSRLNLEIPKSFLEIGAGIGVAGIVVASYGHSVTITDYNKDALNFAWANIHINLGDEAKNVKIKKLDWRNPEIDVKYDYIIGSDVVYREEDFDPLIRLFDAALDKKGEIILSETFRKNSLRFLEILNTKYKLKAMKKVLRSHDEETHVILIRAQPA